MAKHRGVIDEGAKFQIVPNTRKVMVPQSHKVLGIIGSHNSEQITFQCPKMIDGHDVVNCSDHFVSWENADGTPGRYDIDREKIVVNGDNMFLPWVIDSGVTAVAGSIKFAVHFEDREGEDNLLYAWGTTECNECEILGTVKTKKNTDVIVPEGYIKPNGIISVDENGSYDVSAYKGILVSVQYAKAEIKDGVLRVYRTKE